MPRPPPLLGGGGGCAGVFEPKYVFVHQAAATIFYDVQFETKFGVGAGDVITFYASSSYVILYHNNTCRARVKLYTRR